MWGATQGRTLAGVLLDISIHAPRVGSDSIKCQLWPHFWKFQSTLPVWGATQRASCRGSLPRWISIHAPRVGSDLVHVGLLLFCDISIHAPRVGSDSFQWNRIANQLEISIHAPRVGSDNTQTRREKKQRQFQSTLPVWGATYTITVKKYEEDISIHAPRVGSDS